jgi:hypothetical protein
VRVLSEGEKASLSAYAGGGGKLVITGVNATGLSASTNVVLMPECPGKAHLTRIKEDMKASALETDRAFLSALQVKPELEVEALPLVATQIAKVDGKPHIFFANFSGLVPHQNAKQAPVLDIKIRVTAGSPKRLVFLPFLGEVQTVEGQQSGNTTVFTLPRLEKGAVVWIE